LSGINSIRKGQHGQKNHLARKEKRHMDLLGALIIGAAITYLIYQQYLYCTGYLEKREQHQRKEKKVS